jgi:hypothetical protein
MKDLGCEVISTPPGCTCILERHNVDFKNLFKSCYHTGFHNRRIQQAKYMAGLNDDERTS